MVLARDKNSYPEVHAGLADLVKNVGNVPDDADCNPVIVYLLSMTHGSRRTMLQALGVISDLVTPGTSPMDFPWHEMRYQHTAAVRTKLAEKYAHTSANKMLAALKGVLKNCFRLGLMSSDDMMRACDMVPVKGYRVPVGRAVLAEEREKLFGSLGGGAAGRRDGVILSLLYGTGLRRSEVVKVDLAHLDMKTMGMIVQGKGNKERRVYAPPGTFQWIDAWLQFRGTEPGPLLMPVKQDGTVVRRRMKSASIAVRIEHMAARSGVEPFTPHDLRRTFVGDLLDAGVDLTTVQKLAGHSNASTTSKYDRRGSAAISKASKLLFTPYVEKGAPIVIHAKKWIIDPFDDGNTVCGFGDTFAETPQQVTCDACHMRTLRLAQRAGLNVNMAHTWTWSDVHDAVNGDGIETIPSHVPGPSKTWEGSDRE